MGGNRQRVEDNRALVSQVSGLSRAVEPANAERSRDASRHIYARFEYRVTYNIPSLKVATTDPEPFGKPTLLLGSNVLLDVNDATTFTSNGLLNTGLFARSGDDIEGESTPSRRALLGPHVWMGLGRLTTTNCQRLRRMDYWMPRLR